MLKVPGGPQDHKNVKHDQIKIYPSSFGGFSPRAYYILLRDEGEDQGPGVVSEEPGHVT